MPLVSLKLPKKKQENGIVEAAPDKPSYGYGTRINLCSEQIAKMPELDELSVGDEVTIMAKAKIVQKEENETDNGNRKEVSFQLTDMAISADPKTELSKGFKEATK